MTRICPAAQDLVPSEQNLVLTDKNLHATKKIQQQRTKFTSSEQALVAANKILS
jgi:hypothetical protein